jgi:hypothetical protein
MRRDEVVSDLIVAYYTVIFTGHCLVRTWQRFPGFISEYWKSYCWAGLGPEGSYSFVFLRRCVVLLRLMVIHGPVAGNEQLNNNAANTDDLARTKRCIQWRHSYSYSVVTNRRHLTLCNVRNISAMEPEIGSERVFTCNSTHII